MEAGDRVWKVHLPAKTWLARNHFLEIKGSDTARRMLKAWTTEGTREEQGGDTGEPKLAGAQQGMRE